MQSALNDSSEPVNEVEAMRQMSDYQEFMARGGQQAIMIGDPPGSCGALGQPVPLCGSPGIGGAPTRASILPEGAKERKQYPVASGLLDYFPDALCAVANLSYVGNEQHNPGQPLNWARGKSSDEADTMMRHFLQRGSLDKDGIRHTAKMAWRALALLQKEIEQEKI
jgi:hypothetical protein